MFYIVLLILAASVDLSFQQEPATYTLINPQIVDFNGLRNDYFHYRESMIIAKKGIAANNNINITIMMQVSNYKKDLKDGDSIQWTFNTISMPICSLFKSQAAKQRLAVKSALEFLGWNKISGCPIPKARYIFQDTENFDFSYAGPRADRIQNGYVFNIIYNIMTDTDIQSADGKPTTFSFGYVRKPN